MALTEQLARLLADARADGEATESLLRQVLTTLAGRDGLTAPTDGTRLDLDRHRRCGHPEVIFAQGKSVEEIVALIQRLRESAQSILATRVSPAQAEAATEAHTDLLWNEVGCTLRSPQTDDASQPTGRVVVVTAGTSDRPVAEEAMETLRWMNIECELVTDVGVAGPWRILEQLPRLRDADAVIVAAGMEGALPSVVGGWVSCPVIAVPTSVGYGAAFSGVAALLGMLNSCAANVTVVNIDAGFKAGYIAGLIAGGKVKAP